MTAEHPKDLSKILASLVEDGFLTSRGATRATVYHFPGRALEVMPETAESLEHSVPRSQNLGGRLAQMGPGLAQMDVGLAHSGWSLEHLQPLAEAVKASQKVPQETMQRTIVELCGRVPLTALQLASLLNRAVRTLKNHYLKPMVKSGALALLYPEKPNHPQQAYTAAEPAPKKR